MTQDAVQPRDRLRWLPLLLSILALVLVAVALLRYTADGSDQLAPWLRIAGFVLIAVAGFLMLIRALRRPASRRA